jgi:hypothetical protein
VSGNQERGLAALVLINLVLQVFDGVATYVGIHHAGFGEGNPLVAWAMRSLGTGPAHWLFKLQACACLLLVWQLGKRSLLARPALALTAALYAAWSFAPWSAALLPLYLVTS